MSKWYIHQDRDADDTSLNSYSLTMNKEHEGWNTDSGYDGYGLPKELAQWICETLNASNSECPYEMSEFGYWRKKGDDGE